MSKPVSKEMCPAAINPTPPLDDLNTKKNLESYGGLKVCTQFSLTSSGVGILVPQTGNFTIIADFLRTAGLLALPLSGSPSHPASSRTT